MTYETTTTPYIIPCVVVDADGTLNGTLVTQPVTAPFIQSAVSVDSNGTPV